MKYICDLCGYVYDEKIGDPDNGIPAGTKFEDIPVDFVSGKKFEGWYLDANFTTAVDFTNFKVTEDITLYAKWTVNTYTVTFNSNGGSDVASATVNHNNAVTLPTAPTKEGHTFVGWYKNLEDTEPFDIDTPVAADVTLYAKWSEEEGQG